ncbi:uncharacterized protein LOC141695384 [Apium graveolens]|uniref:uncharacterized protein LOC141695384 n=1 Tax=Apium graveolens TaxID=4045 RepID=UPI003D7AFB1B
MGGLAVMWKHIVDCEVTGSSNNYIDVIFSERSVPCWRLTYFYGIHPHSQSLLEGFRLAIEDCELVEMDLMGGEFTWGKSKGKSNWVREKLDKGIRIMIVSRKQFRFRFENSWLKEPAFKEEMTSFWKSLPTMSILPKLLSMSSHMAKWGRRFFHKSRDKVRYQKEELSKYLNREDEARIKCYFEEREKLNDLLLNEELYWKQRAKLF